MAGFSIKNLVQNRPRLPNGLFARTALILLLPLLLFVSVSTFVFFDRTWDNTTRRFAVDLSSQIAGTVQLYKDKTLNADQVMEHARKFYDFKLTFLDKSSFPSLPNSEFSVGKNILLGALEDRLKLPIKIDLGEEETSVYILINSRVLHFIFLTKWLLNKTTMVFVIWQLVTPCLFFFIALLFLRNQVRPLQRLAMEMERFGKGQKVGMWRCAGAREVRQATRAFNRMQERIARLVERRMEMLAGISHDLRTPLTRLELELALLEPTTDVSSMRSDVKEMASMVEAFLAFAKGQEVEKTQNVLLKPFIAEITHNIKAKCYLMCDDGLSLPVRKMGMKRCLTNILSNAAKYADVIETSVKEHSGWITITIDDNGPGIAPEKREEVFQPFVRLDSSRNLDDGGVGLGLAIARDIINQHGGKISLHESALHGLRVTILLPK